MSAIAHNEGLVDQLEELRTNLLVDLKMRLWTNPFAPAVNTPVASFDEATFPGYAAQDTPDWGASGLNANKAESAHPPLLFVSSGSSAETVRGWYLTDDVEPPTKVYLSRPLDTPVVHNVAGKTTIVAPVFTLGDDPTD